jgi:hypothetical protein
MRSEMRTREDIERLEKLIGQLRGLHQEVGALAKKSPKDAVNAFKLKLINEVIAGQRHSRRALPAVSGVRRV